MTKKDKWLLWIVLVFIIVPALKWILNHDKRPVQKAITIGETSIEWVEDRFNSGVIYVFGESGEDILTREFGQEFSYNFILNLKSLNNYRILNNEVTLSHDDLPIRPMMNTYTVDVLGKKGSMVESLKLGCYWDYDVLLNLEIDVDEDIFHVVSNQREFSYKNFSEHHVELTDIISSSSNYMNKDDRVSTEVQSYVLIKKPNSTSLVWDKTGNKDLPIDVEVISSVEEKIRHTNYIKDENSDDMVIRIVDLDSESGYTREVYTKMLLKGITSSSRMYLVNLQSSTMSNGEWEVELEGKSIVTESGFPLYMELDIYDETMKISLIESKNLPVEECVNQG